MVSKCSQWFPIPKGHPWLKWKSSLVGLGGIGGYEGRESRKRSLWMWKSQVDHLGVTLQMKIWIYRDLHGSPSRGDYLLNRAVHQLASLSTTQGIPETSGGSTFKSLGHPWKKGMSSESWAPEIWASTALCLLVLPSAPAFLGPWRSQEKLTRKGAGPKEGALEDQASKRIQGCKLLCPTTVS